MPRPIFMILSAPQLFGFMSGQPGRLREMGYTPYVVADQSVDLDKSAKEEGAMRLTLSIRREISLVSDFCTVLSLCFLIRRHRPEAVLLSGPKAIFLGGISAWLCAVPRRVIVYHGMRQEGLVGFRRAVLDICDRIAFGSADAVLVVSSSLRDKVLARRLCRADKMRITGKGTANGIDTSRYRPSSDIQAQLPCLRSDLGIDSSTPVIGFVGRVTEDKGLRYLIQVHREVRRAVPGLVMLLVGPEEVHTAEGAAALAAAKADGSIRCVGPVPDVRPYLSLMRVMVFPSSREGFPIAPMEAASMEVPTVGFRATGVVDAIIDGKTGVLCPFGDVSAMAHAVTTYLKDENLRRSHGAYARSRVEADFSPDASWLAYAAALS